ncbi:MAG TPA: hypothetical protein VGE34_02150 [Candidatus Saccharimonadales bacterium]
MALFVNQENTRTKLQQKIAAELAEKAKKKAAADGELPDGIDDSAYLENTKKTTSLAWAWILIAVAAVAIIVWLVVISM